MANHRKSAGGEGLPLTMPSLHIPGLNNRPVPPTSGIGMVSFNINSHQVIKRFPYGGMHFLKIYGAF